MEDEQVDREEVVRELSASVTLIPITDIEVNPFQPRREFDEEALQELAESIRQHGIIQPITVRAVSTNGFQIISGERRLRASRMIGLTEIPAYIRIADDQGMLELALIENIQRKDLNPMEISITYKRLMDECAFTHEQLADRVSKKRSTVTNYMRLLKLPPSIQQSLKDEKLTMGHARALVGISDVALQLEVFNRILDKNWSVRDVEAFMRKNTKRPSTSTSSTNPIIIDPLLRRTQDDLSVTLGTKVSLKQNKSGSGHIVIHFNSTGQLNEILDILHDADE
jgi:ParB family chromosome partitioning protein